MSQSDQSLRTIFNEAVEIADARQRSEYLAQACGDDTILRQRIEELIAANNEAGRFLGGGKDTSPKAAQADAPGDTALRAAITEQATDKIGHYKLLQKIGEGGCGVVFMAEQEEPIRRKVALKVIKLGMDTRSFIARFEAERQALALMDHPNIAKVFDAGATDAGRPYFVMELVKGVRITDYCDQNNLTTKQRLDLFTLVCHAIQHAHQKGIIHRDIKPSNILVTSHDGVPVPKVIDFGIAKATTDQRLTDKTLFTAFAQFMGTPAYMSPEQAEMSGLDIDTRSDIYALGVLLYELLTGKTPFDGKELLAAGLEEMRRTIREVEPSKPSTRLATMLDADRTEVAQHRQTEPGKLSTLLRGDLDWIVMKALEKDRTRRYDTANGLAMEIARHLNNEPVLAGPPTAAYRVGKFVRKHRAAVGIAAAFLFLLTVATVVSAWQAVRANRARQVALAEAAGSAKVVAFLHVMLEGIPRSVAEGRDTTMIQELVDEAAKRMDKEISAHFRAEGNLRNIIGRIYSDLGEHGKAEIMYRAALAAEEATHGPDHEHVVDALNNLVQQLAEQGKLAEAEAVARRAVTSSQKRRGDDPSEFEDSQTGLGCVRMQQGRLVEAEMLLRQALTGRQHRLGGEDPLVLSSLNNLAAALLKQGKLTEAETMQQRVLALHKKLDGPESLEVATSLNNLAMTLTSQGKCPEAEKLMRQALEIRQKALSPEHPLVMEALINLSVVLLEQGSQGQLEAAEAMLRQVLTTQDKLAREEQPDTARALDALGPVLEAQNKLDEAELVAIRALALNKKLGGQESPEVAECLQNLASIIKKRGRFKEAERMQRDVLAMNIKVFGRENLKVALSLYCLAIDLRDQRQFAEADKMFQDALTIRRKFLAAGHPSIAATLHKYAGSLQDQGKLAEAESLYLEALAMRTKFLGAENPITIDSLDNLAGLLAQQGRFADAEKRCREVIATRKKVLGSDDPLVAASIDRLTTILWDQDKRADAELTFREALPTYRRLLNNGDTNALVVLNRFAWAVLGRQNKLAEAEALLEELLATMKRVRGDEDPVVAERINNFAGWLEERGKMDQAETMFLDALALRRKLLGDKHADVADSLACLGQFYGKQDKFAEAEKMFRQAVVMETKRLGGHSWEVINLRYDLILVLGKQDKFAEAEPLLLEVNEIVQQIPGAEPKEKRKALDRLHQFYIGWSAAAPGTGKMAKALAWGKKLNEFDGAQRQPTSTGK